MKGFSMGDHAAGSYAFGTFDENQDELARLKQQAAIVSEMEGRVLQEVGLKPVQVYRNGFQPGRFRKAVPSFLGKNIARLLSLIGHYGNNWYDFNRKSRTFPLRMLRPLHQPLELLVISQKV